jgi:hypothetical protein
MKNEIINTFILFSKMLINPHIEKQQLIIPREQLKIIKSMYNHYKTDDCKIKYRDFLCQVENMSIELNTQPILMAEIIAKSINHYGE